MRIAVVTKHSHLYNQIASVILPNKQEYCERHGYDFVIDRGDIDFSRPLNWTKVPAILAHLGNYDWILWSDIDTLFVDMSVRLEDFIRDDLSLVASLFKLTLRTDIEALNDFGYLTYTLHTGNFLVRNDPWGWRAMRFIHQNEEWRTHDLMDEAALTSLYRRSKDLAQRVRLEDIRRFCTVPVGNCMNYIFPEYQKGDFIVHFLGREYTLEEKYEHVMKFKKEHGV